MSSLLFTLIFSLSTSTASSSEPTENQSEHLNCVDTFDQTEACQSPKKTIFAAKNEKSFSKTYNEYPLEEDPHKLAFQFLAISAVPAIFAIGLQIVHYYYQQHTISVQRLNIINKKEFNAQQQMKNNLYWGAISLWVTSALIAGTSITLGIFNPKDGSLNPILNNS